MVTASYKYEYMKVNGRMKNIIFTTLSFEVFFESGNFERAIFFLKRSKDLFSNLNRRVTLMEIFLAQKPLKMTISTSVWGAQHPNAV